MIINWKLIFFWYNIWEVGFLCDFVLVIDWFCIDVGMLKCMVQMVLVVYVVMMDFFVLYVVIGLYWVWLVVFYVDDFLFFYCVFWQVIVVFVLKIGFLVVLSVEVLQVMCEMLVFDWLEIKVVVIVLNDEYDVSFVFFVLQEELVWYDLFYWVVVVWCV